MSPSNEGTCFSFYYVESIYLTKISIINSLSNKSTIGMKIINDGTDLWKNIENDVFFH